MTSRHVAMVAGIALSAGLVALAGVTFGAAPNSTFDARNAALLDIDTRVLPPQIPSHATGDTDWPAYNKRRDGNRYSKLTKINAGNIGKLEQACRVHVSGAGPFSAGTILVNNVLYTTADNATLAIQPVNCDIVWKSIYAPVGTEVYNANRGVAYWNGKVIRGTGDARLVAYDAATGHELWRTQIGDPTNGEYADAAPVAWHGMVYIGLAAGDLGIRGRMMAFDADTGQQRWTFNLIPGPGEYGNDTWPGDTWKTGGGGTWSSYTMDPGTGELFVPVANPAPTFDAHGREGDNLFTNSILVLDAHSGMRLWHYQTRKNDNHDYGVSPPAVLLELGKRKVVAQASKDGYVYMIDRTSHKLIWKTPVTTILNHDADATPEGVKVCPGAKGGEEYNSPGYDPRLGLLIVGSVDWCYKLIKTPYPPHVPGQPFTGGRMVRADDNGTGWVMALDARTGKIRWRYHTPAPVIAAVTPTAGGITFAGDAAGLLYVFRTKDGKLLRKIQTGGALAGGIITYQIHNQQYVAVDSGNISRSSWSGISGIPTLIVYRLAEAAHSTEQRLKALAPDPVHGRSVYRTACAVCHGASGQGGEGPSLYGIAVKFTQTQAAAFIANPTPPMPRLYPADLSMQDVADVAAYVRGLPAQ